MRIRTAPALLALVLAALLLGGCTSSGSGGGLEPAPTDTSSDGSAGGSSDGSAAPDAPTGPACDDVWKVGEDLPEDYTDCAAGSMQGTQEVTECDDDTRLIVFEDTLWAITGDEVVEPEASPLQDTEAYGAAYSECTGE